jgi:dipeptidyl aminopeptidase
MKYPKPGYANPLVSLHLFPLPSSSLHPSLSALSSVSKSASHSHSPPTPKFLDLTWPGQKKPTDQIIFEVAWLKEGALVVKESDRSATSGNVVVFELGKIGDGVKLDEGGEVLEFKGNVTRELVGGEGWIEQVSNICSIFLPWNAITNVTYMVSVSNNRLLRWRISRHHSLGRRIQPSCLLP